MKKNVILFISFLVVIVMSCKPPTKEDYSWIKKGIDVASVQLKFTAEEIADSAQQPRSIWADYEMEFLCEQLERDSMTFKDSLRLKPIQRVGQRRLVGIRDWTSGFFPGTLWYTYELTGDEALKQQAIKFTNLLYPVREYDGTHDLGFMMNCSYGNAERLSPNDSILPVLKQTAYNLISRYDQQIEAIRSWDFGTWNFPVIIDNMMNLDLLFNVSRLSGDPKYKEIAIKHAYKTMECAFRPDYSSYHVVSYNNDGSVESRGTHQGKNDESPWARGQSWAVYGYISCYRETGDKAFLDFAVKIADYIISAVKTEDKVPLWDYEAPNNPDTPRDASAASIVASAFIELSTMLPDGQQYLDYAIDVMKSLSSDAYLAKPGENQGFILMHSVGSLPNGSEIDTPLNYADYYYIEAIERYMKLKGLEYKDL